MARRADGRTAHQLRPMAAEFSLLAGCDGSARLTVGDTEVMVGVQGPRPPKALRLEDSTGALLEVVVSPAAGAACACCGERSPSSGER
jgi:ribonuclease PH